MAKKAQTPSTPPTPPPGKSRAIIIVAACVAIAVGAAVALGLFRGSTPSGAEAPPSERANTESPVSPPLAEPAAAHFGPHTQASYPPLPTTGYPPPRSTEVVSAAYKFAAEHPEVLGYIPCFCGCDRQGHRGNDDCFVARRNARGDVTEWDSHGMT